MFIELLARPKGDISRKPFDRRQTGLKHPPVPTSVSNTRTAAPARRLSECHDPRIVSVVDESRKLVRARRMAKLLECLRFNLTNALAGHAEFFSDFFKGMIGCAADATLRTLRRMA